MPLSPSRLVANMVMVITLTIFMSLYLTKTQKSFANPPEACTAYSIKVKNPFSVLRIISLIFMVIVFIGGLVNSFVPGSGSRSSSSRTRSRSGGFSLPNLGGDDDF